MVEEKKAVWFLRDREGASFLLPLFSTIILDVRGDKGEVGLRFLWGVDAFSLMAFRDV